jgi:heterodisulfide reductase subunit C
MDYTPRRLFAMVTAGMREQVLSANTMWYCVSCYLCTARCPQQIPITELMYALKRMSIAEGYARETDAPALARTFTGYVEQFGRSFEFGLASRFYLTTKPGALARLGPLGLAMMQHGRMSLRPSRIRQVEQLQNIIARARALEEHG